MDEASAAGVLEPGELGVEAAWPEAECLGGLVDAGVFADYEQAVETSLCCAPGEGVAERLGQVTGVASGCCGGDKGAAAARTPSRRHP